MFKILCLGRLKYEKNIRSFFQRAGKRGADGICFSGFEGSHILKLLRTQRQGADKLVDKCMMCKGS